MTAVGCTAEIGLLPVGLPAALQRESVVLHSRESEDHLVSPGRKTTSGSTTSNRNA